MKKTTFLIAVLVCLIRSANAQAPTEYEWLWPYTSTSIWNMPIHQNADYYFIGDNFYHHNKYVDDVFMAVVSEDDPERETAENNCGPWSNKCEACGDHPSLPRVLNFPDMEIGCGTANNTFCFSFPDGNWLFSQAMGRESATSDLRFRSWTRFTNHDIDGDGLSVDGHGATGLSALGGTIRLGELISDVPIQHALKVTAWALEYCYPSSHRWPAKRSDGYSGDYRGTRPKLKIGALLALHKDANLDTMGFETKVGRKLAQAMQTYGAYFVEDSYDWGNQGAWGLVLEAGVQEETEDFYNIKLRGAGAGSAYFRDINRITENVYIVDNNTRTTIGGGPNSQTDYPLHRLAPLLPSCGTENRNLVNTIVESNADVITPQSVVLHQNYPNPFNPNTTLHFELSESSHIKLSVSNLTGQNVIRLADGVFAAGTHNVTWNGVNQSGALVNSGIYLARLQTQDAVFTTKMLLVK